MMWHDPFGGAGTLALAGGAVMTLRNLPLKICGHVRDRFIFTFELENCQAGFEWLRRWLGEHARSRSVSAERVYPQHVEAIAAGGQKPQFILYPRGLAWFRFQGKRFLAWSTKEPLISGGVRETIVLRCFGDGSARMRKLLADAWELSMGADGKTIEVWLPESRDWRMAGKRSARPITSLALPPAGAGVLDDARRFLASQSRYAALGIPWRRGYLFYGPPGNGKSSLAFALASELRMNLSAMSLSSISCDGALADCVSKVPPGHILLLEDVDASWNGRESARMGGITFSGLLNAIDGATALDGRILIMTTNHRDKLDPALIRPGRADLHVEMPNATAQQAAALYQRFFPDARPFEALAFGKSAAGHSLAKIQEELLGWWGLGLPALAA